MPLDPVTVQLKDYALMGRVGGGGIAEIFEARDRQGRPLAIRRYRSDNLFKFSLRRRFTRGVALRRSLDKHPNVVAYIGEGGGYWQPFEVMEFVPGANLKMAATQRLPVVIERPLEILRQAAAGLALVHEAGYLHLDIKPENFLLKTRGDMLGVKITDFDLCLPIKAKRAAKHMGGTKVYEPPEFFRDRRIGVGTDIFAFGVLAYNVCTGQMPFIGSVEGHYRNGQCDVRFPADCGVCAAVQDVVLKCLAGTPRERYWRSSDLYDDIARLTRQHEGDYPSDGWQPGTPATGQ